MKIINPIYDKAFKYLMENEKFAKRILSIILDVPVLEVTLGHQETHFPNDRNQLSLFRLDFRAVVKEADGSLKTVLIELQKSKHKVDIERFRSYSLDYQQWDFHSISLIYCFSFDSLLQKPCYFFVCFQS